MPEPGRSSILFRPQLSVAIKPATTWRERAAAMKLARQGRPSAQWLFHSGVLLHLGYADPLSETRNSSRRDLGHGNPLVRGNTQTSGRSRSTL